MRDSTGELFNPAQIEIRVTNPKSTIVETFTLSELNNPSVGEFSLDYTFVEVEKYSFDIYVDEPGYDRAYIKATVAVTGAEAGTGMPGPDWLFTALWVGIALIVIPLILFAIKRVFKKR